MKKYTHGKVHAVRSKPRGVNLAMGWTTVVDPKERILEMFEGWLSDIYIKYTNVSFLFSLFYFHFFIFIFIFYFIFYFWLSNSRRLDSRWGQKFFIIYFLLIISNLNYFWLCRFFKIFQISKLDYIVKIYVKMRLKLGSIT